MNFYKGACHVSQCCAVVSHIQYDDYCTGAFKMVCGKVKCTVLIQRVVNGHHSVRSSTIHSQILIYCRWVPVYADKEQNLAVMSIGFLLKNKNDAVVWRGPKKHGIVHLPL
jgi:hypothetical protein